MKRKAIQLAKQTIVVSLPSKWVKQQGIKKGDEIDVEERGKELVINSKKKDLISIKNIDISYLEPLINRTILGLYIAGIDEIHINFDDPKLIDKIQKEIMNALIGFEIVEQGKNNCIIKNVSNESISEFDTLLIRIFVLLESMGEEILESTKKKETDLNHVESIDYNINRLTNFCLRLLNKYGYKEHNKTNSIYSIIQGLEHIGDLYKEIANEISNKKLKLNKETICIFGELNSLFKDYRHLFYNFENKKTVNFILRYQEIKKKIKKMPISDLYSLMDGLRRTIVAELLSNQLTVQ